MGVHRVQDRFFPVHLSIFLPSALLLHRDQGPHNNCTEITAHRLFCQKSGRESLGSVVVAIMPLQNNKDICSYPQQDLLYIWDQEKPLDKNKPMSTPDLA